MDKRYRVHITNEDTGEEVYNEVCNSISALLDVENSNRYTEIVINTSLLDIASKLHSSKKFKQAAMFMTFMDKMLKDEKDAAIGSLEDLLIDGIKGGIQ